MLQELYEQYKDTFSKSDHKLIQYLLRNEEQLQYLTSEELSAHTGISPATVSRFWKKIGFQNLKELKIKQRIQDTATPSSRLTSALKRFEETASLTEDLKMHFGNNTAKTLDRMDPALPARAADLLLQAQHVYIYAPDASCGLASIFCYRARRLGIQPVLLEGGSAIYEYMVNITGNDLVLLFSFSRLLGETRILLDHCNKINCPVILFYRPFCDSGRNAVQTDFLLLSRRTK
ncbi:MAG: MurR/RpiR family transcriptional regulator [Clostridium sp.]